MAIADRPKTKRYDWTPPQGSPHFKCARCGERKPAGAFGRYSTGSRNQTCLACLAAAQADREADREVRHRQLDERFEPRQCKTCHEIKRPSQMTIENGRPSPECKDCSNRRKTGRLPDLGHREVDAAPDRAPAEHLRDLLAAARAGGEDFDSAFADCLAYVIACIVDQGDRAGWEYAFRQTEWCWRAGWDRKTFTRLDISMLIEQAGESDD